MYHSHVKLTLIRISELVGDASNALTTPPVGVAYLAGFLRKHGHDVAVVDGVGEAIAQYTPIFENETQGRYLHGLTLEEIVARVPADFSQLLGVSCMFSQDWPVAKRLIAGLRDRFPRAIIVCGGEHVSALAEFSMRDCEAIDYCVRGEGEATLLELVNALQGGARTELKALKKIGALTVRLEGGKPFSVTETRPRLKDLKSIPWPAWDLVPMENYLSTGSGFGINKGRNMPVVASRGCPYACTFCSNPQMWTQRWIPRDPIEVVDEIEHYVKTYNANNFDFYDLTAIVRKDWIMSFCGELERRGLKITYQLPSGTRSEAIDAEVAAALRRTGCCHLVYAPETGSDRMLKLVKKRVDIDNLLASMRAAVREGVFVKMNIVIGFPDETLGDILRTFWFLARTAWMGVHDVFIYAFSPYPGSELFRRLEANGRIKSLDHQYFMSLSGYISLNETVSYADGISSRLLGFLRIAGLMLFYGASFALHPMRVARVLGNLRKKQADTRIEGFIHGLFGVGASSGRGLIFFRRKQTGASKAKAS